MACEEVAVSQADVIRGFGDSRRSRAGIDIVICPDEIATNDV